MAMSPLRLSFSDDDVGHNVLRCRDDILGTMSILCQSCLVQFSSVQDGIYALAKAHMRSTSSLRRFPNVVFETIPMFVWLTMALSGPVKEDRLAVVSFNACLLQAIIFLGFVPAGSVSTFSTLQIFREASHL